jgi:hypothetical protein
MAELTPEVIREIVASIERLGLGVSFTLVTVWFVVRRVWPFLVERANEGERQRNSAWDSLMHSLDKRDAALLESIAKRDEQLGRLVLTVERLYGAVEGLQDELADIRRSLTNNGQSTGARKNG